MRIYRERSPQYSASPIYNLYGKKDNFLIGPYQLALDGRTIITSASDAGSIKQGSELEIGNISGYDLPGGDNSIKPIVRIAPKDNIDLIPDVSVDSPSGVVIGSPVILDVLSGGGDITGTVVNKVDERPFRQIGGVPVKCYVVGFNRQLKQKYIGARVLLNDAEVGRPLLGMLYDFYRGSRGRVFPCGLL